MEILFTATENLKKIQEIQVARLMNRIGSRAETMYFQIKDELKEQSVNAILDAIKTRHIPKRNLVVSQFKVFFKQKQNLCEFSTNLKKLYKTYVYSQFKDMKNNKCAHVSSLELKIKKLIKNC